MIKLPPLPPPPPTPRQIFEWLSGGSEQRIREALQDPNCPECLKHFRETAKELCGKLSHAKRVRCNQEFNGLISKFVYKKLQGDAFDQELEALVRRFSLDQVK